MESEPRWRLFMNRFVSPRPHVTADHWFQHAAHAKSTDRVRWSSARLSVLLWASVTLIYLFTLTSDYYWDGITFALQIEKIAKGDSYVALLFHQNHLLYNSIGFLLYKAFQILGIAVRAITLLQILNAVVGGLAVAVFFRL